jgi:hypothetical protein
MAKSRYIPEPIRCMLWGRAAGRCEFAGCNQPVSWHRETKETVNIAEAAHIIGFSEDGPRGEEELSEELARDISNLMLLCRNCHKPIDANRGIGSDQAKCLNSWGKNSKMGHFLTLE